jgi:hypothetical protein
VERYSKGAEAIPPLAESSISKDQSANVQALATVKEKKPELFEKVRAGKTNLSSARNELKREKKREELKAKAAAM